ncbi:hypothetical protein BST61_g9503 [Cercospora zeina]
MHVALGPNLSRICLPLMNLEGRLFFVVLPPIWNEASFQRDNYVSVDEYPAKHAHNDPDLLNQHAFEGDDSEGKVGWTFRKVLVISILSMLYTGSQLILHLVGRFAQLYTS